MEERIRQLCEQAVVDKVFPGCSVGYLRGSERGLLQAGRLTYEDTAPSVAVDTIYDVASVTKAVATSSVLLKLLETGRVTLDDPVIRCVPELSNSYRDHILIQLLLTYTVIFDVPGGLAQAAKREADNFLPMLLAAPLAAPPGERYFYTNGPAILMGLVIERILGQPLDEAAAQQIFEPLGMKHTGFDPLQMTGAIAPTELDERGEVRGTVHDESAWAMTQSGQRPGAAGLFSTAEDLLLYADMLLAKGTLGGVTIFQPETVGLMHTNQLGRLGLTAGLGWEMGRPEVMGSAAAPSVFMKSGFTGCLMVVDPERASAMVHLSNRTYPKRPGREPIQAFWRELNELIFS